ncbi:MAG TPA: sugar transferase [Bacteroidota bacterium]|nr:sugar transferase [Bacteroidota bacterium]
MVRGFIRRNWRTSYAVGALLVDAGMLCIGYFVSAKIAHRNLTFVDIFVSHKHLLGFALLIFLGSFTALGVYRTIANSSFQRQLFNAGKGYLHSAAVILSSLFLAQNLFYSRAFVLLYLTITPIFYVITWAFVRTLVTALQDQGLGRWNTLAIGSDPNLKHLIQRVEEYPELGYDIVSVMNVPHGGGDDGAMHVRREEVEAIASRKKIGLIVFSSANLNGSFDQLEDLCRQKRIAMRVVSPESDYLFSKARLHDIAGIPLFTPERRRINSIKRMMKRVFDLTVAVFTLAVLSPIFLVVAIATKIESRGPVFFKQKRSLTDQDEPFEFYKFRSMYHTADEQKDSLVKQNEASGALFKIKNDPRLTRVGKIIRKFSIDELPQLFNVIKGDMSLVGPRPLPAGDFALLREGDHMGGYYRGRSRAKPGMTGLWQISGRSDLGFREMVLLDLYYIEKQSILFDIEILAQTLPAVLFGRGAY